MRKFLLSLSAAFLFSLALSGCFGGEGDSTVGPPKPPDTTAHAKEISPGMYVGDYSKVDTVYEVESEFALNTDGSYHMVYLSYNEAFADIQGQWASHDSALFFRKVSERDAQSGAFFEPLTLEDDTNLVRAVTDSSFERKEWTPLRQKPFWITYHKKEFIPLKPGEFHFVMTDTTSDSVPVLNNNKVVLTATDYLYTYTKNDTELFQIEAKWTQFGSILSTEPNRIRRRIDTLGAFGDWDTLAAGLYYRTQSVTDTAFQLWSPPSGPYSGSWDVYSRSK